MKKCAFCDLYRSAKMVNAESDERFNSERLGYRVKTYFKASLVVETMKLFDKGKQHGATVRLGARPLRYCPECGKRLSGGRTNERNESR